MLFVEEMKNMPCFIIYIMYSCIIEIQNFTNASFNSAFALKMHTLKFIEFEQSITFGSCLILDTSSIVKIDNI